MLAKKFDPDKHDVTGWYMSEKLDGVRATFDTEFVTRNGNVLDAPYRLTGPLAKYMQKNFPGRKLDGELYIGRARFNECSGIVRRHDDEWIGIEFHVFDIIGERANFGVRNAILQDLNSQGHSSVQMIPDFVKIVKQEIIDDPIQIAVMHDWIAKKGGEGVMIKNPASLYEMKRSSNLLKVKEFHDCEAKVIDYELGRGKYTGMVGALVCILPNGKKFSVGSGLVDSDRTNFALFDGKTITVKYFELSKDGIPRFPIFKGIRTDV